MAIKLIANYSKRLGLPGYSSHQFSVSIETELTDLNQVAPEAARVYELLQTNVDEQIRQTGFVPPADYGMEGSQTAAASASDARPTEGDRWNCSDKQKELILKLVAEHSLDKNEVDHLARQRFGKGVRQLNKVEASGLIDELLDQHGGGGRQTASGRGKGKEGGMIAPARSFPGNPEAGTLPDHISPTAAKSYLGCSLRYWFERVLRLPKPTSVSLHLGKSVHAALQAFHLARWRGGDDSPEATALAFDDAFQRLEREEGP